MGSCVRVRVRAACVLVCRKILGTGARDWKKILGIGAAVSGLDTAWQVQ